MCRGLRFPRSGLKVLDIGLAFHRDRLVPAFEVDCHRIRCIDPAAIDENRGIGRRLAEWRDDMNSGRAVPRAIRENDLVVVVVVSVERDAPEMRIACILRQLTENHRRRFGSRPKLSVQCLSILKTAELPETESDADDSEDDTEYCENFVSGFQYLFDGKSVKQISHGEWGVLRSFTEFFKRKAQLRLSDVKRRRLRETP